MESPEAYDPDTKSVPRDGVDENASTQHHPTRMCSVLNIVIDHSMEDVSPMEPEEWEQKFRSELGQNLQVPVLRIFGPVVRQNPPLRYPLQSVCLYVHGAFPYMLARPVVAGPDGSLLRASSITNVDWDNLEEVESIQDHVRIILETTLQSMDLNCQERLDNDQKQKQGGTNSAQPIIRKVTVVEGRGFYTFCPGPTAPFLRVEYYNPKLRWKVKLVLEKGLEVPRKFHPDPRQYDRMHSDDANATKPEEKIEEDVLRFHCYEAHIPYTMQFFKDHNLAGMSYIHLRKGRIRGNLPTNFSLENKQLRFETHRGAGGDEYDDADRQATINQCLFLQSNTPDSWLWPTVARPAEKCAGHLSLPLPLYHASQETANSTTISNDALANGTSKDPRYQVNDEILDRLSSDPKYSPPAKCTSCDVEIDCSVGDILNVESIITTLPHDQDERDKIQWRAVPSLQEIWREERARMKRLLSPEITQEVIQDVLSQKPSPTCAPSAAAQPMTLNVKEGAPRSGTRLAVKGMWGLVDLTLGLKEDFRRCLSDILERHRGVVELIDRQLEDNGRDDVHPRRFHFTPHTPGGDETESTNVQSIPTNEEAFTALESLGGSTPGSQNDTVDGSKIPTASPSVEDTINFLNSIAAATPGSQGDQRDDPRTATTQCSPYDMNRFTSDVDSPLDVQTGLYTQLSQLDQSEQPLSEPLSFKFVHDIVSGSMAPAHESIELHRRVDRGESLFEGQECNLEEFIDPETLAPYDEVYLGEEHCRAFFVVESDLPHVRRVCGCRTLSCPRDGHKNAGLRAKPGLYKTVTTGAAVDGLEHPSGPEEELVDDDDDFESLEKFCQLSQKYIEDASANGIDTKPIRQRKVQFQGTFETQDEEIFPETALSSDDESHSDCFHEPETHSPDCGGAASAVSSTDTTCAPCRSHVSRVYRVISLHDLKKSTVIPEWLGHAWRYITLKGKKGISVYPTKSMVNLVYLQPVSVAPTRGHVKVWKRKRLRKEEDALVNELRTKRGKKEELEISKLLPIDSNARKVISVVEETARPSSGGAFLQGIEEVSWELSQKFQMTPTQQSQEEGRSVGKDLLDTLPSDSQDVSDDALQGIGAQGGRIHVEGGGGLKAQTRVSQTDFRGSQTQTMPDQHTNISFATPVTAMSVEVHVQCRVGTSRLDSKKISMSLDSSKDKIVAIVYCYSRDPGGGNVVDFLQRGCICTSLDGENPEKGSEINRRIQTQILRSMPRSNMGVIAPLILEVVKDERHILRRFKDVVRIKDPDIMMSWDTQGAGLGYIIERGIALGKSNTSEDSAVPRDGGIDMVKLLGKTPLDKRRLIGQTIVAEEHSEGQMAENKGVFDDFKGSGLGTDWDDRVGAGAAAASIIGRLVFSGWKIVSEEVKHGNASYLPAIVAAVLNKRIPHHDDITLAKWYASGTERWRVLNHRLNQATATLLLFDALDIIGRAGEGARLSGVEFSQSFPGIRGSQYKVEGVLLRALQSLRSDERGSKTGKRSRAEMANSQFSSMSEESRSQTQSPWKVRRREMKRNFLEAKKLEDRQYFFFSPSVDDTNKQEALEAQALTLEPISGHYTEPVVVCDFTALYPSLVIAYNLCYSTCAGKLEYHSTRREMHIEGRTRGRIGPLIYPERRTATVLKHHFKSISEVNERWQREMGTTDFSRDRACISPSGTIYLSESVLKGVLPQVLDEILTTRAMLKRAAKEYKKRVKDLSPAILRQLEARQLALKYVANVTYGYTSATFSGRCAMPLLADTIVECGRRTLRKAMNVANRWGQGTDPWGNKDNDWLGATVIYGDTDSLFIKMPGHSYKEAFQFGELLCKAVTSLNPPPVQLKLEKVYVGSIMQTMKRYGGMKYESMDQKKPVFEAKGLETVRRDQCALTQKVLRNALITLFKDGIHAVKEYLNRQWSLIIAGKLPVSDFVLTGRVRSKYRGGREGPVQAVLARRLGEADPGRIVRHKERLPYVIVATPGVTFRLKDCVLTPLELLERWDAYKIHSGYYIERHVNAALQRCLGLAPHFVKVEEWYQACPKPRRRPHFWPVKSKRAMITAYFGNDICSLCNSKCLADGSNLVVVCKDCRLDVTRSIQTAASLLNAVEVEANAIANECSRCNGCFESADTFAVAQTTSEIRNRTIPNSFFGSKKSKHQESLLLPLANCVCIDCPNTFRRHRLRERGIEAESIFNTLTR